MPKTNQTRGLIALGAWALGAPLAHAQSEEGLPAGVLPENETVAAAMTSEEEKTEGWHFKLKLGANVAYGHSSNVVGNPDGSTFQLGALLESAAELRRGQHEWLTTLAIAHAQTKTPVLEPFVKTLDTIEMASLYLYKLKSYPWMGPFGRFRLRSVLFPGNFIRPEDTDVVRISRDGTSQPDTIPGEEKSRLTQSFEPLILRESTGLFGRPVESETITLRFLVGPGAKQILTRDGFVEQDDETTPEVELVQLDDSSQVGGEFDGEATGRIGEPVGWSVTLNLFYPFIIDDDRGMEGADLISVEIGAKLAVKLAAWASLDYVLAAIREPLVVDEWQVTNNLLLNVGFEIL